MNSSQENQYGTIRILDHHKGNSLLGHLPIKCCGNEHNIECGILDKGLGIDKVILIESLFIIKLIPQVTLIAQVIFRHNNCSKK